MDGLFVRLAIDRPFDTTSRSVGKRGQESARQTSSRSERGKKEQRRWRHGPIETWYDSLANRIQLHPSRCRRFVSSLDFIPSFSIYLFFLF